MHAIQILLLLPYLSVRRLRGHLLKFRPYTCPAGYISYYTRFTFFGQQLAQIDFMCSATVFDKHMPTAADDLIFNKKHPDKPDVFITKYI